MVARVLKKVWRREVRRYLYLRRCLGCDFEKYGESVRQARGVEESGTLW